MEEYSTRDLNEQLKGKTLRVYWHMLRNPTPKSARAIQRETKISSPSLALHHLNKLKKLGLVQTDKDGSFYLAETVKVGILAFFIGSGWYVVPRYLFYGLFYVSVLVGLLILFSWEFTPLFMFLVILLVFGIISSFFEAYNAWTQRPYYS